MPDVLSGNQPPRTLEKVVRGLGQIRCAVKSTQLLIAPPLTQTEFARQAWPLWPWWPQRYREFARQEIGRKLGYSGLRSERGHVLELFSEHFAKPARSILDSLRTTQPELNFRPDATCKNFCEAIDDPDIALAVVIAHHASVGGVELADGVHSWESFFKTVNSGAQRTSLVLLICSTDAESRGAYSASEKLAGIAYAVCELPFLQCVQFAEDLIHSLSPEQTLEDCWDDAETRFLQRAIRINL